ncbi:MAG: hypothetical protein JGK12_28035 [Microcoleus sp. PH2017_01_SCD_O_A]|uniref:hypothetical protein n=1 Tax=unclassified Microcoleus TaxID=2642155 RepID=UPI001D2037E4|nr:MULTISPECIES: hypothetical protein [unclassified Microcoleus]MCC3427662.1 hypothetical protein [Microcoleus sp. PH2017_01_SCD_O_A]MCC3594870.1 hypothetical protein [Microcoleus sp. PH2017_28_MFU_U_A]
MEVVFGDMGDRSFCIVPIDRPLQLFLREGRSLFLVWKGRSLFWDGKVDRFFYESRDRY